jgi:hypothetical protein
MTNSTDLLSAASQLASLRALQAKPGSSQDPADYQPAWVQFGGSAFDEKSKYYRPELDPQTNFLVGSKAFGPEGVSAIVIATFTGYAENDRVVIDGKDTTRRFAIWKRQPEVTVVRGKGGGLKTDRGGWISRFGEIIYLIDGEICVQSLFDQHPVIAGLIRRMEALPTAAFYEAKFNLTKKKVLDGDYTRHEPNLELLGIVGAAGGPSPEEIAYAKRLWPMIAQISYANPDIPLRLVVNGPVAPPTPPMSSSPITSFDDDDDGPPSEPGDPGPTPYDDGPDTPF